MARTKDPHAATLKAWETRRRSEHEGLGSWDRDGRWTPTDAAALARWRSTNGVAATDVPVPFPVWTSEERGFDPASGDWWHGNRKIDKNAPVAKGRFVGEISVKVSDLIATQHVVVEAQVARNVASLRTTGDPSASGKAPVIVRVKGKMFIYDGHHRASAARVAGAASILAKVFEVG